MNVLPPISKSHNICVICEGNEEHEYFLRLMNLKLWDPSYNFTPINVKSASNVFPRFQNEYQNDYYEIILIFCDTDKKPYKEYSLIKDKIIKFLGNSQSVKKLIMFANPCTMQIILLHFGNVSLKNQGKKTNAPLIEQLTGIKNYDAHKNQIKELCQKINRRNYQVMKERIVEINNSDDVSGSTNFIVFLQRFETVDDDWIKEIQIACLS